MTPRTQHIAVLVGVGAVCVTAALLIHGGVTTKAAPNSAAPTQPPLTAAELAPTTAPSLTPESPATPAWTRPPTAVSGDKPLSKDAASAKAAAQDLERLQRLKEAAEKMRAAGEAGKSPQDVLQAMKEFEAVNGSPHFGGMDLSVMRRNIELAVQMRDRAAELDTIQRKLSQGDKSVSKDMLMAKLDDIRKLQAQLLSNGHGVTPNAKAPLPLAP